jgi:hypothetical protein
LIGEHHTGTSDRRILCRWKRELADEAPHFATVEIVEEDGS